MACFSKDSLQILYFLNLIMFSYGSFLYLDLFAFSLDGSWRKSTVGYKCCSMQILRLKIYLYITLIMVNTDSLVPPFLVFFSLKLCYQWVQFIQ